MAEIENARTFSKYGDIVSRLQLKKQLEIVNLSEDKEVQKFMTLLDKLSLDVNTSVKRLSVECDEITAAAEDRKYD